MSRIVLEPQFALALRNCAVRTVLTDAEGKTIGYFEPVEFAPEENEIQIGRAHV